MDKIIAKSIRKEINSKNEKMFNYIEKLENENDKLKKELYSPKRPISISLLDEMRDELELAQSSIEDLIRRMKILESSYDLSLKNRDYSDERPLNWK